MDSRIREIEQWVDEAKRGLDECGREEYFRKLFLLDAEIRAAIKDSGCIPEAASPQRQVKRVRRLANPGLILSGAMGILLLAATTVYLNGPQLLSAPAMANATRGTSPANPTTYDPQLDRGHIPAFIEGEEIIPFEMLLAAAAQAQQQELTAVTSTGQAALDVEAAHGVQGVMADAKQGQARTANTKVSPQAPGKSGGNRGPSVELVAKQPAAANTPAKANTPRNGASYGVDAFGGTIASMKDTADFSYFPESAVDPDTVNQTKEKAGKLVKQGETDSEVIVETPVDKSKSEDEDADKLDAEALKEKLEKRFNR